MFAFVLASLFIGGFAEECVSGGILFTTLAVPKCYYFFSLSQSYSDASSVCANLRGYLVSVSNAFEQALIISHVHAKQLTDDYWIGLTNLLNERSWLWDDGTEYSYTNWRSDSLSKNSTANNCVVGNLNTGKWYEVDCNTSEYNFVCETTPVHFVADNVEALRCPEYVAADGVIYNKCYIPFFSPQDHQSAEKICNALDGVLVAMNNAQEMVTIEGAAKKRFLQQTEYWIGLTTADAGTTWQWPDGTNSHYQNWAEASPPSSANTKDNCVSAAVRTGKWTATTCDNKITFICQVPPILVPAATEFTSSGTSCVSMTSCPACPSIPTQRVPSTPFRSTTKRNLFPFEDGNWTYFGETGKFYKPIVSHASWTDLEGRCSAEGAHLTSIHSIQENGFVFGIGMTITYPIAIGLYTNGSDGDCAWADGSEDDFTYFLDPPPNQPGYCAFVVGWGATACGDANLRWQFYNCSVTIHSAIVGVCSKTL